MAKKQKYVQKEYFILNTRKVKYIWPFEKKPLNSEQPIIIVSNIILLAIVYFIFFISLFLMIGFMLFKPNMQGQDFFYHCGRFWLLLLSKLSSLFETAVSRQYIAQITSLSSEDGWKLLYTWLFALIPGFITTAYLTYKSMTPTGGSKQIRGIEILEGKQAFIDLQIEFSKQCSGRPSDKSNLIVGTNFFYDPQTNSLSQQKIKPNSVIPFPEDMRRTHDLVIGGTGRGKTQLVYSIRFAQIYRQIRNGDRVKLFIVDTPKADYSRHLYVKDYYNIAPQDKHSVIWDLSKDLWNDLLANAFWEGRVPSEGNEKIWSESAIAMGTGCTKLLQEIAPKAWNYGMLSYITSKTSEELKILISPIYPEAVQILRSAEQTISSVMFNLGAYSTDLIALARIYDCFDSKMVVHQATAKALKMPSFIEYHAKFMSYYFSDGEKLTNVEKKMREEERISAYCFHALIQKINREKPDWNWRNFANMLNEMTLNEIFKLAIEIKENNPDMFASHLSSEYGISPTDDMKVKSSHFRKMATIIMTYAKEWDKSENRERLSIGDWIVDENPEKKILVLKPNEAFSKITNGVIQGILHYFNAVILSRVQDDQDKSRKAHIIIDEVASFGNIKNFLDKANSLYRSRGWSITLAMQDLSQLVEIYKENFVNFLTSNVANIYILGVNNGDTANKLSELLGEKSFEKVHINESQGETTSRSFDIQQHDEKVMKASEFNLLGAKSHDKKILYLYIPKGINKAYLLTTDIIGYKVRNKMTPAEWTTKGTLKLPLVKTKYNTKEVKDSDGQLSEIIDEEITNVDFTDIESIMKFGKENPSPFNKFVTEQKKLYRANPIIQPISEISLEEQDEVSDMVAKEVIVNSLGGDALTIAKGLIESLQSKERPIDANTNTMR